jgi:hypothetical protein
VRKLMLAALFMAVAAGVFAQSSSDTAPEGGGAGGVQFSGVLSANFIDDFNSSTAYFDNGGGLSYLLMNAALKDGPFGFDSQILYGPGAAFQFKYGYGHANFWNERIYIAIGRFVDPDTFALNSFFVGGSDGAGSYGNPSVANRNGGTGFGVNGIELKLSPLKDLVFGFVLPYQGTAEGTVDTSLKAALMAASYTVEKVVQLVLGYSEHHIGVADLATPIFNLDQNKLYAIANILVSDDLVMGARYELDHDVSKWQVISHNAYVTLGGKLGDFSIGGDAGFYFPQGGSMGFEVLGSTSYTLRSVLPSVDLQPFVSVSYVSSAYQESPNASINVNPQLRLLLGKSQHEIALGYTVTYDLDHRLVAVDQLNILMQVYF